MQWRKQWIKPVFPPKLGGKVAHGLMVLVGAGSIWAGPLSNTVLAQADTVPQTIQTQPNYEVVTFAKGYEQHSTIGVHASYVIRDKDGNYLFCIQWSKDAPHSQELQEKYEAEPGVEWLVNNFYSGNRYRSLGSDKGDYWLYQAVIHWTADPNDRRNWGGLNGAIQDHLNDCSPDVRQKLIDLHNKALSITSRAESQSSSGSGSLNFSPSTIKINPDGGKPSDDGFYHSNEITLHNIGVQNAHVWLENQPNGTVLEGNNVNFNDVWDNTKMSIKIPAESIQPGQQLNMTLKAHGTWTNYNKLVWIYGDKVSSNTQNVAKQTAVTVPMEADTEIGVTARGRLYQDFQITKRSADGIVPGAKFVLVRRTPSGDGDVNISIEQAKKEAYRNIGDHLELSSSGEPYIATADSNGLVKFEKVKLTDRKVYDYYAVEVQAPNGYALSQTAVKMKGVGITAPQVVKGEVTDSTIPLPKTGSERLLLMGAGGMMLVATASGMVLYQRRKRG
ncbi:LPXTG cell wall anchor domain-containing protein [Limosilactobacillus reuteri]|uniref:LPXTG cell wall anchor domain-containing protein n=1 Tax=Limosilactobacillus reuteri TaxID=1598 RepID=UPI001E59E346|nr:LPXTG cell wall anchor domain-containing protein [Limosilactobacillus reuteri]MCC4500301.1 LPXTG cell wall anchor domain-containing protein [Limosilactobacillus reuteri]MCC4500626.1 LPXTG cell wall anchor domain-containing protein [Limosilactobacillus reuteri]